MYAWAAATAAGTGVLAGVLKVLVAVAGVAWLALFPPRALLRWLGGGRVYFCDEGDRIALTIDDGPHPASTPLVLAALARHGVRATFFLIGGRAARHPDLVRVIAAAGHEVGHHDLADRVSALVPADELLADVERSAPWVWPAGCPPMRWFRPGCGLWTRDMAQTLGRRRYRLALGDCYALDAHLPWPRFTAWHTLRRARAGSVVVLHEGTRGRGERTARVIDAVVPELRRRGLRLDTLSGGRVRRPHTD